MKFKFKITGVDCPVCASKLATNMANIEGVEQVKINFFTEKLTVESELSESALFEMLTKCARAFDGGIKIEK